MNRRIPSICLFAIATFLAPDSGSAQTFTTLASLNYPQTFGAGAALVQSPDGNIYGAVPTGGLSGAGLIFKMTPAGALTTIATFGATGTDPAVPNGLLQGADGNFYGTTAGGGVNRAGSFFKITPGGVLTVLHSFTQLEAGGGGSNLTRGSDGNFYGTTIESGSQSAGTFIELTPAGALTVLHNFTPGETGGGFPSGVVQGPDGSFYGITNPGDAVNGTIFKVTASGSVTTLYRFNGANPTSVGLILGTDGNFYGTTATAVSTIFKVTPGGTVTTLHTFGSQTDGYAPIAPLIQGSDGNLYGTTSTGGLNGWGTVFRLQIPTTSSYTCTNTTSPVITSIDSASAYGGYNYFASGSWLEIKGTNLADTNDPRLSATANPGQWTASDFNNGNAPTSLDGISVRINGKPAFVWYLSPGQLNVQAPEDTATGNVAITVTNCNATSFPFTFGRRALAPGMLAPANYAANGTQYMVATFQSDGAYVLNTATGAAFGLNSRPAKPGDGIIAYGIGFGDVNPSILPGVIVGQSNTLINPVSISFGAAKATIAYQGLAGGFVGLYEFYFTVPAGLTNGDYQINVVQNGSPIPQTMYLTVHN